ncbi:hypothetical protein [Brotaphodocola sp.]|uniref:hypothetical protein n=1 Tax=Brotaphodocola sp. TaxID=3073577 RepID=UPI003D7D4732
MRRMRKQTAILLLTGGLLMTTGSMPVFAQTTTITAGASRSDSGSGQSSTGGSSTGTGWKQSGGGWIYYLSDGTPQQGGFTPDGYLVDGNGSWSQRSGVILEESVSYPDCFVPASQMRGWGDMRADLERVGKRIQTALGNARSIQLDDESISYYRTTAQNTQSSLYYQNTQNTTTLLLSLYQDSRTDGYQLRVSTNLGNRKNGVSRASTYDYAMFYLMLAKISHVPEQLADAIYGSWQGNNPYGLTEKGEVQVGDVFLSLHVENGAGVYMIRSAWQ